MKLLNPTDDELNAAVTKYIVKSVPCDQWKLFMHDSMIQGDCGHANCHPTQMQINYCKYADAILPWLEKWPLTNAQLVPSAGVKWYVDITLKAGMAEKTEYARGRGETLAKACVLALLRANGVEIEFT